MFILLVSQTYYLSEKENPPKAGLILSNEYGKMRQKN